jgi:L-2-hydroxyglutarate oxidase LhgO
VQSSNVDGRHVHCKSCRSAYYSARYNAEKRKQKYLEKHKEEKEARKDYYRRNKEDYFIRKAQRRAQTLQATPKWYDDFDKFVLSEAYRLCKMREKATGVKWEVDHIVPLISDKVCGLHWYANWRVITQFENRSKGNSL